MLIERRISIILIAMISLIISSNFSAMAYELPHEFWAWTLVIQMQQAAKIMMKR